MTMPLCPIARHPALLLLLGAAVLTAQPGDPAAVAAEAQQAMEAGRFAQAAELYTQLYPLAPDNLGMLMNLGMARSMAGQSAEAIEPLSKAVAKDPSVFPAQLFLGSSYFSLGKFENAVRALEAAAKLDPEHPPVRRMLSEAYARLGRPNSALPHLKKLTALEPEVAASWALLGQTYAQIAQDAFAKLNETAPESAHMLRLMGDIRFSAQQYPSSFYLYREALKRKTGWRGLHAVIAEIYRRTDRAEWAAAEEAKERALGEVNCETERFECLFAEKKLEELRLAVATRDNTEGYYWLTQSANLLSEEAFAHLEQMEPSLGVHVARAEAYKGRGQFAEAAKQWAAALKLAPSDSDLEAEHAIALFQSGQLEQAEPRLKTLLTKSPEEPNWSFMMGYILLGRQQAEEAAILLAKAVKLDPKMLPAQQSLGRAYMQLGRDADAIPHLKQALPLDEDGSLTYQLAQAYRSTGDREAAAPLLERYQQIQAAQQQAAEENQADVQITAPQ